MAVKVGLVGCGFMGRMHGAVYGVLKSADLIAACDVEQERAAGLAEPHKARVETDFANLLADPEIEVIDICLPTYLHAEFAIKALEAGKNVLCEKPMALSLNEADKMISAAKASEKLLMIAHCIRFWPEYVELMKQVELGHLGELLSLNMTRYGAFPSWSWEGWLGKEELAGGGALDMHVHDSDFAIALLGEPTGIRSDGTIDEHGVSQVFTTLRYGKTIVHLEGGWNLPVTAPFKMSFRAIFEKGLVNFDGGPLAIYDAHGKREPELPKMAANGVGGNISDLGGYFYEMDYFYDCLAKGEPVGRATPESSKASLALALKEIELVKESNR